MLKEEDKKRLQERFQEEASDVYQPFSKELFKQYSVKRGLRNDDGTGVMAGLTSVGAVLGYYIDDGEKIPMEGHLRYRGYDLTDIVKNCEKEKRFGFEEVAYLLYSDIFRIKRLWTIFQDLSEIFVYCRKACGRYDFESS